MASELLRKLESVVPLQILAPAITCMLTLAAVATFALKAKDSDIYTPSEKLTVKVEEVRCFADSTECCKMAEHLIVVVLPCEGYARYQTRQGHHWPAGL
jgi:hypothetical protein